MKVLSEILTFEINDDRLSLTTITDVKVSKDLTFAKIFVSNLDPKKKDGIIEILDKSKGFFRKEIGRKLSLRVVPEIAFKLDETLDYSNNINELLRDIKKKDEENK